MKRQRGRGRKPGGGGGGNPGNRPLESNGPEVKIRGTAAQIYEKYTQYARDAQSAGDRVKTENYMQHAEHYFRIMAATMPREQRLQQSENAAFGGANGDERDGDDVSSDPMKLVDDGQDDGGDDFDGDEADAREDDQPEGGQQAGASNSGGNAAQPGGDDRGDGQGRNRRRRNRNRNRPDNERGDRPDRPDRNASGNAGNGGGDTEARSALDALAQKQAAVAGS